MLAQSFMTAADLGLPSEQHRQALIKTLVLLETDKLTHYAPAPEPRFDFLVDSLGFTGLFNMRWWNVQSKCGSVACIGGTAELVGDVSFGEPRLLTSCYLRDLFMPRRIPVHQWSRITTAQAASALRSFLTIGDARWNLAIGGS